MLQVDQIMDIKELAAQGISMRRIAQMTGHSRNTVRKVLRGEHAREFQTPDRGSKLDPFKDYVRSRFEETGLSAVRLLEEIKPMGYTGSISGVRRFVHALKKPAQRDARATVRFETPPGQQAQADWGYCGVVQTPEGKQVRIYVFVMVLGYSRMLHIRFTTSMRLPELIACHEAAFAYFGGVTKTILYDNMKQVRISPRQWNEQFLDFSEHHGFIPKTHRPYRPRTKGKVERMVDYVKDNFLKGRTFIDLDDLNQRGVQWLDQTANVRVHGTTGEKPVDLLTRETLRRVDPARPYRFIDAVKRTVNTEAMVTFAGSCYSVPPALVGEKVEVASDGGVIVIRAADAIIAEHREAARPGQSITQKEHVAELWKLIDKSTQAPPKRPVLQMTFGREVEQRDLSRYEEILA